jgi:hypothetical protein
MPPRILLLLFLTAACGDSKPEANRPEPLSLEPPAEGKAVALSLPEGTTFTVAIVDAVASGVDKMGGTITAVVSGGAKDASGRDVIPSGSFVKIRIDELEGATTPRPAGAVRLSPVSVLVQQQDIPLKAQIDSVPRRMVDRTLLIERATALTVRLTAPMMVSLRPKA